MQKLCNLFQTEILISPDKEVVAKTVFDTIKGAVHEQLMTGALIESEDFDKARAFFRNGALWTLVNSSNTSIPVPKATADLAKNPAQRPRLRF
ncbi:hypothetical protein HPB52_004244 [Rhipicephalus sanguineus]|uniref:Uncharacterized protein n=1 Tax=Rhipicephalus sanguineus TaxID=34632 RepID=A0A9D4PRI7_RHISA|nr:hypothetical protein HPB52_004244 [Rhipicephalus sanguineus]